MAIKASIMAVRHLTFIEGFQTQDGLGRKNIMKANMMARDTKRILIRSKLYTSIRLILSAFKLNFNSADQTEEPRSRHTCTRSYSRWELRQPDSPKVCHIKFNFGGSEAGVDRPQIQITDTEQRQYRAEVNNVGCLALKSSSGRRPPPDL